VTSRTPERFAIAGELLVEPGGDPRWNNLGHWHCAGHYSAAAEALARRHGEAVGLVAGDRVLDLGCGPGVSLVLWRQEFGVAEAVGLDCRSHDDPAGDRLVGQFDAPLPEGLARRQFDAILCVDAAYHATSLSALLAAVEPVLAPGARLAVTLLVRPDDFTARPRWQQCLQRALLKLAAVPEASFRDEAGVRQQLARHGWSPVCEDIGDDVLPGFAHWVTQRRAALGVRQRCSPAWLKIQLTAHWCRWMHRNSLARYLLVSAVRVPPNQ
jgi:SAM-dependent methyltransferase